MSGGHAVAAGHRLTANVASEIMAAGGTAADAAVAAALMAMVVEPVLAGLLGGGFAMVRPASGQPHLLDAFVDTPARRRPSGEADIREIHADFGPTTQAFHIGVGTIAVPCLPAGLAELHARFGRMPFSDLTAPAARAAREGWTVTPYQARLSEIIKPILVATPSARALFCESVEADAPLHPAGALVRNSALADVLEEFGAEGARFVAEGEVAARFASLAEEGGHITRGELARAAPVWRTPLRHKRSGVDIALNPAPSLGGVLIAAATELAELKPDPAALAHVFETVGRARDRVRIGADPVGGVERLLADETLAEMRRSLAQASSIRGTTHISAVDRSGLGVSLTLSNGEGCGVAIPGTGLMPNNMLGESDLVPDGPESWTAGVRLSSMMAPMALSWPDGRVAMLGSGGSNRIRTALAQVLLRLIDRGESLEAAIRAPRLHLEVGEAVTLDFEEPGLAEPDRAVLLRDFPKAKGWEEHSMFFGGVHGVVRAATGATDAFGDPRRDGIGFA